MLPTSIKPIFHRMPKGQSCASALVLMRIRIQIFVAMRIHIRTRIQGAKPMRIHADLDPCQTLKSQKVEFLHEKYNKTRYWGKKHIYDGKKSVFERQQTRFTYWILSFSMLQDPEHRVSPSCLLTSRPACYLATGSWDIGITYHNLYKSDQGLGTVVPGQSQEGGIYSSYLT